VVVPAGHRMVVATTTILHIVVGTMSLGSCRDKHCCSLGVTECGYDLRWLGWTQEYKRRHGNVS
jgi:hypothetical protein